MMQSTHGKEYTEQYNGTETNYFKGIFGGQTSYNFNTADDLLKEIGQLRASSPALFGGVHR